MILHAFGIAREIIGGATLDLASADATPLPSTVGELDAHLRARFPQLTEIGTVRYAVNQAFAAAEARIGPKDELAIIPPVSGG